MNPVHLARIGNDFFPRYDFLAQTLFIDPVLGLALDSFTLISTGYSSYIFVRLMTVVVHSPNSDLDNKAMSKDIILVVFSPPFGMSSGSLTSFYSCRTDEDFFCHNMAGSFRLWGMYGICGLLFCVFWSLWLSSCPFRFHTLLHFHWRYWTVQGDMAGASISRFSL